MPGSKPIKTITIPKSTSANISKNLSEHLSNLGWRWFVDYYILDTEHECAIQIFQEDLIIVVKQYILENMI